MAGFNYVSCIKIAGAPILPPLISDEDRKVIAYYKEKAIQKEREIASKKNKLVKSKTTDYLDNELLSDNSSDVDISANSLETSKVMDFIRQALFDVGHSDVKLLQEKILEEMQNFKVPLRSNSCDTLHLLEDISFSEDKLSFDQTWNSSHSSNRMFDKNPSEEGKSPREDYRQEISKVITPSSPPFSLLQDNHNGKSLTKFSPENMGNNSEDSALIISKEPHTPKLIRRNSYTLESPSPSVLLYLKSLPRYQSDSSSFELTSEKRIVKNLNDYWNSPVNCNDNDQNKPLRCPQSNSPPFSQSPIEICDNHGDSEKVNDKNSNVVEDKAGAKYKESSWHNAIEKHISIYRSIKNSVEPVNVTPEKEKAIIIIQAGIRGYLIRRLMKTNKVMELRNTIKDSLICALALHSEQNVSSADVNLHVRLIRQVTAACYELHAIFFEYNQQERMNLISLDREKLLSAEKAKMNLRRLKGITSDEDSSKNGLKSSNNTKKPRRPSSLPLTRRTQSTTPSSTSSLNKPWR